MTDKTEGARKFQLGDRVTKTKGSNWTGRVVGFYSTSLTPIGYAVESETEKGSVQIYPEQALRTHDQAAPTRPDLAGIEGLVEAAEALLASDAKDYIPTRLWDALRVALKEVGDA